MYENPLTPEQQSVLSLIAQGRTVADAAEIVGVHRNTIGNWRRAGCHEFRKSWDIAQFEQAAYWRDRIQSLGELAIQALQQVLTDPKTSPSVRLKASLAVVKMLAIPVPAQASTSGSTGTDSSIDQMIAEAGHIPAHWREQAKQSMAAAASTAANPAQSCTTPAVNLEKTINQYLASPESSLQDLYHQMSGGSSPTSMRK